MKVFFRVDASKHIGTGHVSRCLTLAHVLKTHGCEIEFACIYWQGNLISQIKHQGFKITLIPLFDETPATERPVESAYQDKVQKSDAISVIEKLCVSKSDLVVVDHYGLGKTWEAEIKKTGCKLCVIDDLANRQHECDFLLDQNLHQNPALRYKNKVPGQCNLVLGLAFALLRSEFYKLKTPGVNKKASRVLIYLGFIDPTNITAKVLGAINDFKNDISAEILLSPLHPNFTQSKTQIEMSENISLHLQPTDMISMLQKVDFVIGAAGSATWERCCLGLPSILIALTDNQKLLGDELSNINAVLYLGAAEEISIAKIHRAITIMIGDADKRRAFISKSQSLVDGAGADRVAAILMNKVAKDHAPVFLKKLKQSDAKMIYAWQHEPGMRTHCRIDAPPGKAEHEVWINSRIKNHDSVTQIIFHGERAVGMVRLDKLKDINASEVSILLTTKSRGLGIAKLALQILISKFKTLPIRAFISQGNTTSQHLFSKLGFKQMNEDNWWILNNVRGGINGSIYRNYG